VIENQYFIIVVCPDIIVRVGAVIEAPCNKPEGCGFNSW